MIRNILIILWLGLLGCSQEEVAPKPVNVSTASNLEVEDSVASIINAYTYYNNIEISDFAIYDITGHTVDVFNTNYPPEKGTIPDKVTGELIKAEVLYRNWHYSGLHGPDRRYLVYAKSTASPRYSYIYFNLPKDTIAEIMFRYDRYTRYAKPIYIKFTPYVRN